MKAVNFIVRSLKWAHKFDFLRYALALGLYDCKTPASGEKILANYQEGKKAPFKLILFYSESRRHGGLDQASQAASATHSAAGDTRPSIAFGAHRQSRLHTAKRSLVQSTCHTPYCNMDIRVCSQSKSLELYPLPDMVELHTADIDCYSTDSFILYALKIVALKKAIQDRIDWTKKPAFKQF
ncbi:hypothetical protein RRG08_021369 [Elysia crispata]|uniref:Uncharacterized protein n=1 Tax=Elysia crispata TaxID=231223 RepID=A0AAE0YBQ8_9GAST|nr:hypothetical protein RRG08_021369 [Elysia crispata]